MEWLLLQLSRLRLWGVAGGGRAFPPNTCSCLETIREITMNRSVGTSPLQVQF